MAVRQANEMTLPTRSVQSRGIDRSRAIIHTADAIQWICDLVSRRVHRHGDRPSQCGAHTLEAVASAQRRVVLQRTPGKEESYGWLLRGGGDDATVDEMLCMQAARTRMLPPTGLVRAQG